eukprot:5642950-Ditylum_brightwellii.AAC.1
MKKSKTNRDKVYGVTMATPSILKNKDLQYNDDQHSKQNKLEYEQDSISKEEYEKQKHQKEKYNDDGNNDNSI